MAATEKQPLIPRTVTQTSAPDNKSHYTAIVMGAGISGMATAIQLKRKLGLDDVLVYEKTEDIGGTWNVNRYPGAACDIPITFYSFSFYPAYNAKSNWAGRNEILEYLHEVQDKFNLRNIVFRTSVETAHFSRDDGLWHLTVRDEQTGQMRERTCNLLLSCLGGLAIPNELPFDPKDFDGEVFHSAKWREDVDLKDKDVVIVGNGCSAAQIVPEVIKDVRSVTQIARSRQTFFPRIPTPEGPFTRFLIRWLPGFGFLLRSAMFFIIEGLFKVMDIEKGAKAREHAVRQLRDYMHEKAPKKYWKDLEPDFDVAAKRRVFDSGYYEALGAPNMELIADDTVTSVKGDKVFTKAGRSVRADVIVLATGFKVRDFLFPLKVTNDKGVSLQERLNATNVKTYQSTLVADFPNFFWIMGPNSATGHSSVLFTSEAQINLVFHLIRPILKALHRAGPSSKPAPYVEVKSEAEDAYFARLRAEMKNKIWEKDGGVSWYVDPKTGLCTALYPWSQVHFWRSCTFPRYQDFKWTNATAPALWRSYLGWY